VDGSTERSLTQHLAHAARRAAEHGRSLAAARRRYRLPPPAILAVALLLTILSGTVLLRLPIAQAGPTISWLDAFFTATSATCVTGLVVVDTATQFTVFGQVLLLILMQLGGLGVMTIGTTVLVA
jgi:trk system potassium uptake protein TrkH